MERPGVNRVCVFCGSNSGSSPRYAIAARALGARFARDGIALVYGGGRVGMMGELADSVIRAGGHTVGVIPRALLDREVGHSGLSELHVVETMHERKKLMADLSDAFIALPGGLGTLEEVFEIWTWAQLGIHRKPVGFLDVDGYYAPLFAFLDRCVDQRFVRPQYRAMAVVDDDIERLLMRMRTYAPPEVQRWLDHART